MCSASVCGIVVAALPLTELCSSVFYRKETVHIVFFLIFVNRFKSMNEDAIFRVDFDHLLNQELVIKPGENSAEISVNVTEDILPENNETFLLILTSLDKVTIIPSGSTRITILNNGKTYCLLFMLINHYCITLTDTLTIPDITKIESNNYFFLYIERKKIKCRGHVFASSSSLTASNTKRTNLTR